MRRALNGEGHYSPSPSYSVQCCWKSPDGGGCIGNHYDDVIVSEQLRLRSDQKLLYSNPETSGSKPSCVDPTHITSLARLN